MCSSSDNLSSYLNSTAKLVLVLIAAHSISFGDLE